MTNTPLTVLLPDWLSEVPCRVGDTVSSIEGAMDLAVEIAEWNVRRDGGGPFGALVIEESSGLIQGIGVNRVIASKLSAAHAELLALSHAQSLAMNYSLRGRSLLLISTAAPCTMCLGATIWSGIEGLVIGARREDVEQAAGFDEGPEIPAWRDELTRRGLSVREDVGRDRAVALLRRFAGGAGVDYRPR